MDPYGCIRMHMEAISIDFHWFTFVSGGCEAIRARRLASLWRPVGPAGTKSYPLKMCLEVILHSYRIARL